MSLSVIHFSDIHIKNSEDVILKRVNELKTACVSSLPCHGDVVIAISGDVAFSGEKQQYTLAKDLIDAISEYISNQKASRIHVVCVPGNHDCDFTKGTSVRNALVGAVQSNIIERDYYENVSEVQHDYNCFAKSFGIPTDYVLPRVEVACGDNSVLFILANTAWMSVLHETPGKIVIPCNLFESTSPDDYKVVFYVCHHPLNWLEPDYKKGFVDHIRKNSDMILVGHEHARDSYEKIGDSFSVFCNHGKELQDSSSNDSAFSVINFDNTFQNYSVIDFKWDGNKYCRYTEVTKQFRKNKAAKENVYCPNEKTICYADDIGIIINHFAKENVSLLDLFVWPDFCKSNYSNEKNGSIIIRTNSIEEFHRNTLTILVGRSCSGKTTIAKRMFLDEEPSDSCCLLLDGARFASSDEARINEIIEKTYIEQYSKDYIEEFRQLPKNQRSIIVDNFDLIKNVKGRRSVVLDYLCGFFGRVTILLSSSIELSTILTSNSIDVLDHVMYYEILPLGNRKRKEMISKWYHLNENILTEEEISDRVDRAIEKINIFLGNGKGFVPGTPVFVLSVLQNIDAIQRTFTGSKYGFLYESLILSSLSKISKNYINAGSYDIDIGILSELAFNMLQEKKTFFTEEQIELVVSNMRNKHLLEISASDVLKRMVSAKIIDLDEISRHTYRFMYPYIFYYFCGRYIAYHIEETVVQDKIEYMSSRLFNETYGNIVIFVCHFANNSDIIDTVLLNAYDTLPNYEAFDFTKTNTVFEEIEDAVDTLIPKIIASSDADVSANKDSRLARMDELGVNDGQINRGEDTIDDEISEQEKDMADVVAALKTIEVLGEILQNYPVGIEGEKKVEIIDEIQKLGMRSVQAIIKTMGYLEKDLVEYVYARASREKKYVSKEQIVFVTHQFINLLITGMARGMVHQVAVALNSEHLLLAAKKAFEEDNSISSKLVLLDLELNCLNICNYTEIKGLKKEYNLQNEKFASRIVDSIVGYYLNYHRCDYSLRAKLCSLCGLSQQQTLIASQQNHLN